jgi:hypothetical protein
MARDFNGTATTGTGEYLEVDATPLTAVPITVSAWCYPADTTNFKEILDITDKDNTDQWLVRLALGNDAKVWAFARDSGANNGIASTSTTYGANAWCHACGVFESGGRAAFLNGGGKGTNATAKSPTGIDRISVGRAGDSTPSDPMQGRLAEIAVWDAALTDGEVALLARGVSPWRIRPGNLKLYYPLYGSASPEPNLAVGGTTYQLTVTGTPVQADHAPVASPFAFVAGWAGAFTSGGAVANTKSLLATQAQVVSVLQKAASRARAATQATSASVVRTWPKALYATQAMVAILSAAIVTVKSLVATQATAQVLAKLVGVVRAATQGTNVPTFSPSAAVSFLLTQAQTALSRRAVSRAQVATQATAQTQTRQVGVVRVATQAAVATLSTLQAVGRALYATQAQAVTVLQRQVGVVRVASQAQATALTRLVGKLLYAVQTAATVFDATRIAGGATLVSLIATQAQAALQHRQAQLVRAATQAQAVTVLRRAVSYALRATQAASTYAEHVVGKLLYATQAESALLTAVRVSLKTLLATQAAVMTQLRQVGKLLTPTQAQSVTRLTRAVTTTLYAAQAGAALLTKAVRVTLQPATQAVAVVFTAAQGAVTTLKTLLAVQEQAALLTKQAQRARVAVQTAATVGPARAVVVTLLATQATAGLIGKAITKALRAVQDAVVSFLGGARPRVINLIASQDSASIALSASNGGNVFSLTANADI